MPHRPTALEADHIIGNPGIVEECLSPLQHPISPKPDCTSPLKQEFTRRKSGFLLQLPPVVKEQYDKKNEGQKPPWSPSNDSGDHPMEKQLLYLKRTKHSRSAPVLPQRKLSQKSINTAAHNHVQLGRLEKLDYRINKGAANKSLQNDANIGFEVNRELQKEVDRMGQKIMAIHKSIEVFDPTGKPKEKEEEATKSNSRRSLHGDDDEVYQRLEAYKYVRKYNKDPPPQHDIEQLKEIVRLHKANSHVAIKRPSFDYHYPEARRERAIAKIQRNRENLFCVRQRGSDIFRAKHQYFVEYLQKSNWCPQSNEGKALSKKVEAKLRKRQWLTFLAHIYFIDNINEGLKLEKMDLFKLTEKLPSMQKSKFLNSGAAAEKMKKLEEMQAMLNPEAGSEADRVMRLIGGIIRVKTAIKRRRHEANKLHNTLCGWSKYGRPLLCFKKYYRSMNRIQTNWKSVAKRFTIMNEKVEKIWIKHERIELTKELQAFDREQDALKKTPPDTRKLQMDERVTLAQIDDKKRRIYIAHEMTGARYKMLPAIYHWQSEMEQYWCEVEDWRANRDAQYSIGQKFNEPYIIQPGCPVQFPSTELIIEWLTAARKDPNTLSSRKSQLRDPKTNKDRGGSTKKIDEFAFMDEDSVPIVEAVEDKQVDRTVMALPSARGDFNKV